MNLPISLGQTRLRILLYGGRFANSGMTVAFLNLLGMLSTHDVDVTVVTECATLMTLPDTMANLAKVPPNISVIRREGEMRLSAEEQPALLAYYTSNQFTSVAQAQQVRQAFAKEAVRVFGDATFDIVIDFCGYSRFWSLLMAAVTADRRLIWQHNDLLADATARVDVLFGVFQVYRWYDSVVSVCDETRAVNAQKLGHFYASPDAAITIHNVINFDAIYRNAARMDAVVMPRRGPTTRFITVGRLSPEKAQERAIRATALLVNAGHDIELLILGDGPLRPVLAALIDTLGMADCIFLTGHVDNPYPMMADSDCFVLPSDYEGQALVLIEALALQLPIIATDIPCARGLLVGTKGRLVDHTVNGVAAGMRAFLQGNVGPAPFDPAAYRRCALNDFVVKAVRLPLDAV